MQTMLAGLLLQTVPRFLMSPQGQKAIGQGLDFLGLLHESLKESQFIQEKKEDILENLFQEGRLSFLNRDDSSLTAEESQKENQIISELFSLLMALEEEGEEVTSEVLANLWDKGVQITSGQEEELPEEVLSSLRNELGNLPGERLEDLPDALLSLMAQELQDVLKTHGKDLWDQLAEDEKLNRITRLMNFLREGRIMSGLKENVKPLIEDLEGRLLQERMLPFFKTPAGKEITALETKIPEGLVEEKESLMRAFKTYREAQAAGQPAEERVYETVKALLHPQKENHLLGDSQTELLKKALAMEREGLRDISADETLEKKTYSENPRLETTILPQKDRQFSSRQENSGKPTTESDLLRIPQAEFRPQAVQQGEGEMQNSYEHSPKNPGDIQAGRPSVQASGFQAEDVFQQIIAQARVNLRGREGEMEIQLKPEYLGGVKMRVAVEDGQLRAHFTVETPLIRDLLENNLPVLREALMREGLSYPEMDVNVQEEGSHSSFAYENSGEERIAQEFIPEEEEVLVEGLQSNRVDYRV